jgi:nucleoside-diphosphate-sugar epimerase
VPDTGLQAAIAEHLVADGRRIVITGAGGWLGLATLELLHAALGDALPKRVAAFGSDTRALRLRDGTQVLQRPLADMAWLPTKPTLVLHLAFLTKDRAESMDEDAYRAANHAIGDTVLNALDSIGTEAVFLASSGAAALTDAPAPAMHLYGAMKREDEERFAHWAQTQPPRRHRAHPQHLRPAYEQARGLCPGQLHARCPGRAPHRGARAPPGHPFLCRHSRTDGAGVRHAAGRPGVVRFDSGGIPLELGDIAQVVADAVPGASVERAPITDPSADRYHGDGALYSTLLAQHGLDPVDLVTQVSEALNDIRNSIR